MTALLNVTKLSASYGDFRVLHGIDLTVERGGVTALLGANGAGKTTTLRALCGMIKHSGDVVFDGVDIARCATEDIARLGIAHVPEGRGTFIALTVEENLRCGAMTRKGRASIDDDIERAYHWFPRLKERCGQQAGTLSGGEQQMLAVARALMLRPKLMLLDEPSFGLAPIIVSELFSILRKVNEQEGVGMLIVEQNAALALELARQAFLIETGRILISGSVTEIRDNESIRAAYLGY
ncbi:ABC transporter ATP-binding protein [Bradyrhizobium sp. DOA9]|uniref:ABC transporter ATP-binding protein n=1 Tax=Bradyrhizobium sp. DOA9 TaxID=1126627 RepID=UPI0004689A1E|nr:ABC transporter ATP-binding protein [Bradyrhizobium sp. DOA9]GAJ37565.1 high-affinity branched-chain amino acid transport ATP-binding protein BivF [Bradyrhizobium sp. DOA9]